MDLDRCAEDPHSQGFVLQAISLRPFLGFLVSLFKKLSPHGTTIRATIPASVASPPLTNQANFSSAHPRGEISVRSRKTVLGLASCGVPMFRCSQFASAFPFAPIGRHLGACLILNRNRRSPEGVALLRARPVAALDLR